MRVNVQLIDAESGAHLWAERFDKPVADLFDMQDEIVARLATALEAQIIAAEARRSEGAPDPDAMDLYFQGMASMNMGITPANFARARALFDRALEIDPVERRGAHRPGLGRTPCPAGYSVPTTARRCFRQPRRI